MRGSLLLLAVFLAAVVRQASAQVTESKVVVDASELKTRINKNIYGHFSEHLGHCIYGGYWVGEKSTIPNTNGIRNDVVEALKRIRVPVLRWPGGCFADEYHWMDGIGPREKRPSMINTHWGGVTEDNSFGTHEFLELCRQLGCEPYFCGNVGSGTVQELSQWVEYVNSDNISPMTELRKKNGREKSWGVKYWGIGNEPWGCGGNMRPEYYADLMRRYGTYLRNYGQNKVFRIASGKYGDDYNWTEVLMRDAGQYFNGLSYHYYAFGDGKPATEFDEHGWFNILNTTLKIDEYLTRHSAVMDKYDPYKTVALVVDEWGTWHGVEPGTNPGFLYQQNTMRDAVAAGCNLNIFNNHCDRVRMANIAQTINVLQAMILTDGPKMVLTPTYHVFDLYKVHQDALWLKTRVQSPDYVMGSEKLQSLNCSASIDNAGKMHVSLVNIDPKNPQQISCSFVKFTPSRVTGRIMTASVMNAHNTFDRPHEVEPKDFTGARLGGGGIEAVLPPMSVVVLEVEGKVDLKEAQQVKNAVPGVQYKYFEGEWQKLPRFDSLRASRSGVVKNVLLPEDVAAQNFGMQYTGYLKIPADGFYTIYLNSDDGANFLLDGDLLVHNDGVHAPTEASGGAFLRTGYHSFEIGYFQGSGRKVLEAKIEGPGMAKQVIPEGMLFRPEK